MKECDASPSKSRCNFCCLPLIVCCLLFVACNQPTNQFPAPGTVDTLFIAQDTAMQLGLENSYEYHKSLVVDEKTVYDVVGYGGRPSVGDFAILKRDANNKVDTVLKGKREGMIVDAYWSDSNSNNRTEIYLVIKSPLLDAERKTFRYEMDAP